MSSSRTRIALVAAAAVSLALPLAIKSADAATMNTTATAAPSFTAAQVLAGVMKNSTKAHQVNTKPHINTQTRAKNVNVFQVSSGVFQRD